MKPRNLYRRTFVYLQPYIGWLVLSLALSSIAVGFDGISVWMVKTLMNALFKPDFVVTAPDGPFTVLKANDFLKYWTYLFIKKDNAHSTLTFICICILGASFLKNVIGYIQTLLVSWLNLSVVRNMRTAMFAHILKLPVSYYDRNRSGSIMSHLLNDVHAINNALTNTFNKLLTDPFYIIFYFALMCILNFKLMLLSMLMMPVLVFIISRIGGSVRRRSKRALDQFSGMFSVLHETLSCIRVVKMFNMGPVEEKKFRKENDLFIGTSLRTTMVGSLTNPLIDTLGYVAALLLIWFGGKMILSDNSMKADDFILFIMSLFFLYRPIKSLSGVNNAIQGGVAAAERVFAMLDATPEPLAPQIGPAPAFDKEIIFREVRFTYPQTETEVLHNISFTAHKGDVVAIVGPSGAGKSTILDLLPLFYDITGGAITIDGRNIREMDLSGLRSLFGIVAQETTLFNDTVAQNIAYGLSDVPHDRILTAARAANALEFIEKMPQGFETVIGERGVTLSGGQRQRLSIARALLKNPPILLLDEATSALDTESEHLVQSAINNLMQERTALVVAHRLSTIRNANQILVLEDGIIVESGRHEELLAANGRYRYYYDIQFKVAAG